MKTGDVGDPLVVAQASPALVESVMELISAALVRPMFDDDAEPATPPGGTPEP